MARAYTYIQPRNKCNSSGSVDTSNLATKEELQDGIQEAKDYTDDAINNINQSGGSNHVHTNKSVLDQLTESNGDLFFNGKNLSGVIFETVEG